MINLNLHLVTLPLAVIFVFAFGSQTEASHEIQTTFNTPGFKGEKSTTLDDEVIRLIELAAPGSDIHFSIYHFSNLKIAESLLRANARGVKVNAVFDGSLKSDAKKAGTAVNALLKGMPSLSLEKLSCQTSECIKFCRSLIFGGSCRGWMNNHNKFLLFSHLGDGRKNIVALSSANWTNSQQNNYNDLLVFSDDAKLYAETLGYWHGLHNRKSPVPLILKGDSASIFTFPNKKGDPVLELLNQTTCQLPDSKIRVAQSRFTDSRIEIAKRLAQLSKEGCDVKVLTRDEPDKKSPGKKIKAALGSLMTVFRYKLANDQSLNSNHSKIVLIEASINNSPSKISLVLAGSHNLNGSSLDDNDELLARVTHRPTYEAYLGYWNGMLKQAIADGVVIR